MKRKDPTNPLYALLLAPLLVVASFIGGVVLFAPGERAALPGSSIFPGTLSMNPDVLSAKAAVLYDPTNGRILFAKNLSEQLPLASLTKLMTAQIVLESSQNPQAQVKLPSSVFALEGDAGDWGFRRGDIVSLRDLIKIGLVASSNHAMAAAAESLGPDYLAKMNGTASRLGLSQTYFLNPTGLDVNDDTSGGYGSAYDVARLAALFYKNYPQYFELTSKPGVEITASNRTLAAAATAAPLQSLPGFVGAKTGYTDLAGGNLVAIFDVEIGHPLVAVVLGSSVDGRFEDIKSIISAAQAAAQAHP